MKIALILACKACAAGQGSHAPAPQVERPLRALPAVNQEPRRVLGLPTTALKPPLFKGDGLMASSGSF